MLGLPLTEIAWIFAAAFIAGLVRGFAGFGTAMIYLPIAGQFLSPFAAITTMVFMDIIAPLPNVPRTWRHAEPRDIGRLMMGFVIAMPLGLYTLTLVSPEVFRYTVSGIAIVLLICLLGGFRYRGVLTKALVVFTGMLSGFLGGVAGVPGPPVILLYMASLAPSHVVRANNYLFLIMVNVALIPGLALFGRLEASAIALGLLCILPAAAGNYTGSRLFRPGYERIYRSVAYLVIALSALSGLPLWD